MLLQLWEIPSDDNSSYSWLVPLCLGVHWDVHLGIEDEAGFAGLPEQRLVMCFKQSEFEVVDVIIFIWVVDSQVFVKGIVFSSVLYCVSVLQSATVARIPRLPQGPSRGGEVNNHYQYGGPSNYQSPREAGEPIRPQWREGDGRSTPGQEEPWRGWRRTHDPFSNIDTSVSHLRLSLSCLMYFSVMTLIV